MFQRASGVLVHISSLPSEYGIGGFGRETFQFIDMLHRAGFKYWQVLPFGPTDAFYSPYASISAFAGNTNFIDLEQLQQDGLLTDEELTAQKYANPYTAAYEFLSAERMTVLYKAYTRMGDALRGEVRRFAEENAFWLDDYALYIILKEANCGKEWYEWEDGQKFHEEAAVKQALKQFSDMVDFIRFQQYLFYSQWKSVKAYAREKGVEVIGDLPIYVSMESSDVWGNRGQFDIGEDGRAKNVAGVPPDYFSEVGQKWGHALYNWDKMKQTGYDWWMKRLRLSFELFDVVRIDHFRAFSAYWSVPAEAPTAKEGRWIDGPGMDFFRVVFDTFPDPKIIAEDLGLLDDGVLQLMKDTGLPGMRIMQFGFIEDKDNMHLPHNYPRNSFAYTGTHDNNTALGWLWEITPGQRKWALDYCGYSGAEWAEGGYESVSVRSMARALWQSPAAVTVLPIQDICGFGKDTKMNVPGVPNGNWAFRISRDQLQSIGWDWLQNLNRTYMRYSDH